MAMMIGAGLSISGAAFQGMFQNPLVSPYLLGVSAGAGFGAVLAILFGGSGIAIQLGPNGCGKTTLLNCIHGDLRLKEGEIVIDGRPVQDLGVADIARKMGYVFQEHSAPFPYTVMEVVAVKFCAPKTTDDCFLPPPC